MRFSFDRVMTLSKYAESYNFVQVFRSLNSEGYERHWRGVCK